MTRTLLGAVLATLLIGVAPPALLAQDSAEDPAVARVNGETILRSDVLKMASELPAEYQAQLAVIFPMLIERLVDLRLIAQAADGAGLAEDEEVQRRMALRKQEIMRDVYIERALAEALTDEALQARYETYLAENPPETEVNARHILLASEEDAKAVIVELDQGADFETLARERSTGPSSSQGGELGFFTKDQMVPEFAEAAFTLESGTYSQAPVQTQFGWHVILVVERRTQEPAPYDQVEDQLQSDLSRETIREMVAKMRESAEVEMLETSLQAPGGEEESTQQ